MSDESPSTTKARPETTLNRQRAGRALSAYGLGVALPSGIALTAHVLPPTLLVTSIPMERLLLGGILGLTCLIWGRQLTYDHRHGVVWFALGLVAITFTALTVQVCGLCARSQGGADMVDLSVVGVLLIAAGLLFSKLARLRWATSGQEVS